MPQPGVLGNRSASQDVDRHAGRSKRGYILSVIEKEIIGPRSVTRLPKLFEVLAKAPDGMTLAELSVALETPKSSLLNLLRPLVGDGYLTHGAGRYLLGPMLFRLAADILSQWKLPRLIRPYMEEVLERTGETVVLCVLDRDAEVVTYVEVIESNQAVRFSTSVGKTRPLYCTAAGRVLLAFSDKPWREAYMKHVNLKRMTPTTTTSRPALVRKLEEVRKTGVSLSYGEANQGLTALSVPLFGANGDVVAALMVAGPSERFEGALGAIREAVVDVATRASGALHGANGSERDAAA